MLSTDSIQGVPDKAIMSGMIVATRRGGLGGHSKQMAQLRAVQEGIQSTHSEAPKMILHIIENSIYHSHFCPYPYS